MSKVKGEDTDRQEGYHDGARLSLVTAGNLSQDVSSDTAFRFGVHHIGDPHALICLDAGRRCGNELFGTCCLERLTKT